MSALASRSFWFRTVLAASLAICLSGAARAADPEPLDTVALEETLAKTVDALRDGMGEIPLATQAATRNCDGLAAQALESLDFARTALAKGDITLASDSLGVARGLIGVALAELPEAPTSELDMMVQSASGDPATAELQRAGMTVVDIENVKVMVDRMAADRATTIDIPEAMEHMERAGFDIAQLKDVLNEADLSARDVAFSLEAELDRIAALSSDLSDMLNDPSVRAEFTAELRDFSSRMGVDLQNALEAVTDIRDAIEAGAGLDLDSMAQDMGFDSFADAVDAYNDAYGTNYTEAEARQELGQ